jgi:3-dehydroquinate dehydratase-2
MRVLVIHGPNLNMLGIREPEVYGSQSLREINDSLVSLGAALGCAVETFQSNHEGGIVDRIQAAHGAGYAGAIINPGAYTHTSIAILDAIKSVVHLSNIHRREEFRRRSFVSEGVAGIVMGFGARGYAMALRAIVEGAG